jgi:hypothetical protein
MDETIRLKAMLSPFHENVYARQLPPTAERPTYPDKTIDQVLNFAIAAHATAVETHVNEYLVFYIEKLIALQLNVRQRKATIRADHTLSPQHKNQRQREISAEAACVKTFLLSSQAAPSPYTGPEPHRAWAAALKPHLHPHHDLLENSFAYDVSVHRAAYLPALLFVCNTLEVDHSVVKEAIPISHAFSPRAAHFDTTALINLLWRGGGKGKAEMTKTELRGDVIPNKDRVWESFFKTTMTVCVETCSSPI